METVQYKCPNCGGELTFDAQKQGFGCEYCQSFFTEAEIAEVCKKNESIDLEKAAEDKKQRSEFEEHTNLYTCPSCGAEIMSEETTSATFCYYCHNPVILTGRLSGDYKPGKVIAFKIAKEKAHDIFNSWSRKKWFIPSDFKSEKQLEKMAGVYVPFWLADCQTKSEMSALCKKIRTWTTGEYNYTETKEYIVWRKAEVNFNGIPADGASKIDDGLMESIEPFDYNDVKDFSMSYLSGFYADKYDVNKANVFPRIKSRAQKGCEQVLRSSIQGYNSVSVNVFDCNVMNTDWQYVLMPIWFMVYKYKDKNYSFAINGQTGKLSGIPPLCLKKLIGFCGALTALGTAIGVLGGYLLR